MVSTQSIFPTILDVIGVAYDPDFVQSESLARLWAQPPRATEVEAIVSTGLVVYDNRETVIVDPYKLIRTPVSGYEELCDLRADPGERNSLISELPEVAESARATLEIQTRRSIELRERLGLNDREHLSLDPEEVQRLKSLGYLP